MATLVIIDQDGFSTEWPWPDFNKQAMGSQEASNYECEHVMTRLRVGAGASSLDRYEVRP